LFELPLFVTFHSFARLEQTCNNPHHGISPDRNRVEIIGVDLPAFLLSKNLCPDPVRAASLRWPFPAAVSQKQKTRRRAPG
jgi:hypothetical protein